jgi:hypothetical protein
MNRVAKSTPQKSGQRKTLSTEKLDQLIEDATVDAYDESEQASGFFTMLEDNLVVPFKTVVLGVEVNVEQIDLTEANQIVAICTRGKSRQRISLLDLPLPDPPPKGYEWIAAYCRWASAR